MRAGWMTMMLVPLAACAQGYGPSPATPPVAENGGTCRDDALAAFVGKPVSAELGAEMLKASGARTLRWGGPGMAMTMDYRQDRLTVAYDEARLVTSARCG